MRKLLFLFWALLATTTLFGREYFSLISVTDGTAADWDVLPAEYVASATHTEGCSYDGLKSVKVYCDDNYLNILVEVNLDVVTDREWTPFHIFLNADGSANTGGFGDSFADADAEWMLETAIYSSGYVNSYNPAVFKWWGEVGGSGWLWQDPDGWIDQDNCRGAVVCEGSYPAVGTSQVVDGDLSKVEIQILKERVPAQWANEFTIGVEIEQNWWDVGHLPNAADDEIGNTVLAEKLRVLAHAVLPQDGLHYAITSHVEPYTMAVVGADADITTANIRETIELIGRTFAVTSIGNYAFRGCSSLTSITIPNSMTSIGSWTFAGCSSLSTINMPNKLQNIGNGAFAECSALTAITIPNTVTSMGGETFVDCSSLEYLSIPNSVKFSEIYEEDDHTWIEYSYGFDCIINCDNLKTLIVPADFFGVELEDYYEGDYMESLAYLPRQLESLTINGGNMTHPFGWDFMIQNRKSLKHIDFGATESIAEEAFTNFYNLEALVLPSHLETVPYMAVAECVKLKSISIPATVTTIEDRAFENCRMLSSVAFAENGALTRIGNWAFYNNHELTNLVIPEGVTEVGHAAFYGCTYLKEMTLPSTVQDIADNGFALCAKLRRMNVNATTPPQVEARTFEDVDRTIPVVVPDESVSVYKSAPVWQEFNIVGKNNVPSAVDNVDASNRSTKKLLRDGNLVIIRDGVEYNVMGQEL